MTVRTKPAVLTVWAEAGDVTQPTNAEIQTGWTLTTIPPSRQRFNWILNFLSNGLNYLMQYGIPEWDAAESYPIGARIQTGGNTYKALTPNTNKAPASNPTDWERWGHTNSELDAKITAHTLRITTATATAGQTGFNAPYTPGACWVTRNGLDVDFTGTNGTSITLSVAASAGDVVKIRSL